MTFRRLKNSHLSPARRPGALLLALLTPLLLALWGGPHRLAAEELEPATIRLLPLLGDPAKGKVLAATLTLERRIQSVTFYLDGKAVAKRRFPPFETKLRLAEPPRPQTLRVEAFDENGKRIGEDEMVVRRQRRALRVRIQGLETTPSRLRVQTLLTVPDHLEALTLQGFISHRLALAVDRPVTNEPLSLDLPLPPEAAGEFVRIVLHLADGRRLEDVRLLDGSGFSDRVDVHLRQVQVVVTDADSRPLQDLEAREFELWEEGEKKPVAGLFLPDDVSLVLGLALDSSGSMLPIWRQTQEAARLFLQSTLTERDRGFLVNFDDEVHLSQPVTADVPSLVESLEALRPEGNTALFDSILFSLLQFDHQAGRRGLVVITDGVDSQSLTDPKRTIEVAKQLGVPVYVINLESRRGGFGETQGLHLLTDPSGGRLFRAANLDTARRALGQIERELRHQYVLTYYSDLDPDGAPPKIEVKVPGRKKVRVKAIHGVEGFE